MTATTGTRFDPTTFWDEKLIPWFEARTKGQINSMVAGLVIVVLIIVGLIAASVTSNSTPAAIQVTQVANTDMVRAVDLLRQGLLLNKQKDDEQDKTLATHTQKFTDVDRSVANLNQRFGALSDAQKADPVATKALKDQVDALEKLVNSMKVKSDDDAKAAKDIKDKVSSLQSKLDGALATLEKYGNPIGSANAQEKPKAPPVAAPAPAPAPAPQAAAPQYEEQSVADEPQARQQEQEGESGSVSEWHAGKNLFKIAKTPPGFQMTSMSDPQKSARCLPPHHLYRTDSCWMESDGVTRTCKLGCR